MPKSNTRKGRLVIVTGIPGVGKTTVLTAALAACKERSLDVSPVNYGNVMFDEASKNGLVKTRDEMRGLPVRTQVQLQLTAAKAICKIAAKGNVLLDTHMFINTPLGFMPGIPLLGRRLAQAGLDSAARSRPCRDLKAEAEGCRHKSEGSRLPRADQRAPDVGQGRRGGSRSADRLHRRYSAQQGGCGRRGGEGHRRPYSCEFDRIWPLSSSLISSMEW